MNKHEKVKKIEEKIGLLQGIFECPICLELMKNPVSTKCDHKFCRHCLLETIGHSPSAPCPICKEPFTKRSIQTLKKWRQIVNKVGALVQAYQIDTGLDFCPPPGASLDLSQTSASTSKEAPQTAGSSHPPAQVYVEVENEKPCTTSHIKTNTNISNGFPSPSKGKKRQITEKKPATSALGLQPSCVLEPIENLAHAQQTRSSMRLHDENKHSIHENRENEVHAQKAAEKAKRSQSRIPAPKINTRNGKTNKSKKDDKQSRSADIARFLEQAAAGDLGAGGSGGDDPPPPSPVAVVPEDEAAQLALALELSRREAEEWVRRQEQEEQEMLRQALALSQQEVEPQDAVSCDAGQEQAVEEDVKQQTADRITRTTRKVEQKPQRIKLRRQATEEYIPVQELLKDEEPTDSKDVGKSEASPKGENNQDSLPCGSGQPKITGDDSKTKSDKEVAKDKATKHKASNQKRNECVRSKDGGGSPHSHENEGRHDSKEADQADTGCGRRRSNRNTAKPNYMETTSQEEGGQVAAGMSDRQDKADNAEKNADSDEDHMEIEEKVPKKNAIVKVGEWLEECPSSVSSINSIRSLVQSPNFEKGPASLKQDGLTKPDGVEQKKIFKSKGLSFVEKSSKFNVTLEEDPYKFVGSQKTPKQQADKKRKKVNRSKGGKKLELTLFDDVDGEKTEPKSNKKSDFDNVFKVPVTYEKRKPRSKSRKETAVEEPAINNTPEEVSSLIDKISEAEDFDLMLSQQFREMESKEKAKQPKEKVHEKKFVKKTGGKLIVLEDFGDNYEDPNLEDNSKVMNLMIGENCVELVGHEEGKGDEKVDNQDVQDNGEIHTAPQNDLSVAKPCKNAETLEQTAGDVNLKDISAIVFEEPVRASQCRVIVEKVDVQMNVNESLVTKTMPSTVKVERGTQFTQSPQIESVPSEKPVSPVDKKQTGSDEFAKKYRNPDKAKKDKKKRSGSLQRKETDDLVDNDVRGKEKAVFPKDFSRKPSELKEKILMPRLAASGPTLPRKPPTPDPKKEWSSAATMKRELAGKTPRKLHMVEVGSSKAAAGAVSASRLTEPDRAVREIADSLPSDTELEIVDDDVGRLVSQRHHSDDDSETDPLEELADDGTLQFEQPVFDFQTEEVKQKLTQQSSQTSAIPDTLPTKPAHITVSSTNADQPTCQDVPLTEPFDLVPSTDPHHIEEQQKCDESKEVMDCKDTDKDKVNVGSSDNTDNGSPYVRKSIRGKLQLKKNIESAKNNSISSPTVKAIESPQICSSDLTMSTENDSSVVRKSSRNKLRRKKNTIEESEQAEYIKCSGLKSAEASPMHSSNVLIDNENDSSVTRKSNRKSQQSEKNIAAEFEETLENTKPCSSMKDIEVPPHCDSNLSKSTENDSPIAIRKSNKRKLNSSKNRIAESEETEDAKSCASWKDTESPLIRNKTRNLLSKKRMIEECEETEDAKSCDNMKDTEAPLVHNKTGSVSNSITEKAEETVLLVQSLVKPADTQDYGSPIGQQKLRPRKCSPRVRPPHKEEDSDSDGLDTQNEMIGSLSESKKSVKSEDAEVAPCEEVQAKEESIHEQDQAQEVEETIATGTKLSNLDQNVCKLQSIDTQEELYGTEENEIVENEQDKNNEMEFDEGNESHMNETCENNNVEEVNEKDEVCRNEEEHNGSKHEANDKLCVENVTSTVDSNNKAKNKGIELFDNKVCSDAATVNKECGDTVEELDTQQDLYGHTETPDQTGAEHLEDVLDEEPCPMLAAAGGKRPDSSSDSDGEKKGGGESDPRPSKNKSTHPSDDDDDNESLMRGMKRRRRQEAAERDTIGARAKRRMEVLSPAPQPRRSGQRRAGGSRGQVATRTGARRRQQQQGGDEQESESSSSESEAEIYHRPSPKRSRRLAKKQAILSDTSSADSDENRKQSPKKNGIINDDTESEDEIVAQENYSSDSELEDGLYANQSMRKTKSPLPSSSVQKDTRTPHSGKSRRSGNKASQDGDSSSDSDGPSSRRQASSTGRKTVRGLAARLAVSARREQSSADACRTSPSVVPPGSDRSKEEVTAVSSEEELPDIEPPASLAARHHLHGNSAPPGLCGKSPLLGIHGNGSPAVNAKPLFKSSKTNKKVQQQQQQQQQQTEEQEENQHEDVQSQGNSGYASCEEKLNAKETKKENDTEGSELELTPAGSRSFYNTSSSGLSSQSEPLDSEAAIGQRLALEDDIAEVRAKMATIEAQLVANGTTGHIDTQDLESQMSDTESPLTREGKNDSPVKEKASHEKSQDRQMAEEIIEKEQESEACLSDEDLFASQSLRKSANVDNEQSDGGTETVDISKAAEYESFNMQPELGVKIIDIRPLDNSSVEMSLINSSETIDVRNMIGTETIDTAAVVAVETANVVVIDDSEVCVKDVTNKVTGFEDTSCTEQPEDKQQAAAVEEIPCSLEEPLSSAASPTPPASQPQCRSADDIQLPPEIQAVVKYIEQDQKRGTKRRSSCTSDGECSPAKSLRSTPTCRRSNTGSKKRPSQSSPLTVKPVKGRRSSTVVNEKETETNLLMDSPAKQRRTSEEDPICLDDSQSQKSRHSKHREVGSPMAAANVHASLQKLSGNESVIGRRSSRRNTLDESESSPSAKRCLRSPLGRVAASLSPGGSSSTKRRGSPRVAPGNAPSPIKHVASQSAHRLGRRADVPTSPLTAPVPSTPQCRRSQRHVSPEIESPRKPVLLRPAAETEEQGTRASPRARRPPTASPPRCRRSLQPGAPSPGASVVSVGSSSAAPTTASPAWNSPQHRLCAADPTTLSRHGQRGSPRLGGVSPASASLQAAEDTSQWVITASGINRLMHKPYIDRLVQQLGCAQHKKFHRRVTHLIIKPVDGAGLVCQRTLKYFQAVAHRRWVLSVQWVVDSVRRGQLLPMEDYEICQDTTQASPQHSARRARLATSPLLKNTEVCCLGDFDLISRDELTDLAEACGAATVHDPTLFSFDRTPLILVEHRHAANMLELPGLHKKYDIQVLQKEWLLDSIGEYAVKGFKKYNAFAEYKPVD